MTFKLSTLAHAAGLLFVATAASAQPAGQPQPAGVTIYGVVDLALGKISSGTSSLFMPPPIENGKHGTTTVKAGGPTLLGFRGLEDLGDGLAAGFDIQHRFVADTGTLDAPNTALFWQGKSLLFLRSKTLGEVFLGRDNLLAFYNAIPADPFGFDYSGAALGPDFTMARYSVAGEGGFRASNQVGYRSPRFSGLGVSVATALGEGTSTGRKRNDSLVINYIAGPAYVGLGFDRGGVAAGDRQLVNLTVSYDLGVVKLAGSAARSSDDAGATPAARKVASQTFAATVPVGAGYAKAALGRIDPDGDANNSVKWAVGYEHFLSKRTSLKASYGSSKTEGLSRTNGYEAGLVHRF